MEYKKYQHIEKLGTTEVEGILEGQVSLFYKIDGTNSCIFLKDDNTLDLLECGLTGFGKFISNKNKKNFNLEGLS